MKKSISQQLLDYLRENHGIFPSGDLQRLEWHNIDGTKAVPRTIVRRLQELSEEGSIHCEMRNNHAHYSADPIQKPEKVIPIVILSDGTKVPVTSLNWIITHSKVEIWHQNNSAIGFKGN